MFANVRRTHLRALLVAGLIAITSVSIIQRVCAQSDAANQWTWMGGNSSIPWPARAQAGVYGTLGTPAAGNLPGGRVYAMSWTDSNGNFWLFGGAIGDVAEPGNFNDLWEFNPSINEWAWMGGSSTIGANGGQFGVYGTLGTPAPGNIPGGRSDAVAWTDSKGHFWLYGGRGTSADYGPNLWLNDLWEFDPSTGEWTWMGGDSTTGGLDSLPGVYGTLGTPAPGNNPGSREGAVGWTDNKGNLWLFGGTNDGLFLNDLWEYNPSTDEWAWMGGSSTIDADGGQPGVNGTLGTPAAGNNPGARFWASSWTDGKGNFWLFGGYGFDSAGNLGDLNDLWEFNPATNEWAWMGGSSTIGAGGQPGVYGTLGTPAAGNVPGGRDSAMSWTDRSGNLWLFGGNGYDANGTATLLNDLWEFSPPTNQWTWMGGDSTFNASSLAQYGVYGELGVPAGANIPGIRYSSSRWTDGSGNFWLFGGEGFVASTGDYIVAPSDLWRYQPSSTPAYTNAATPTFSVAAGTYTSTQTVTISDATDGATIYYTTDGTAPTLNSNTYTGPLTVSLYSTTETINAMAVAANYFNSAVASATYIIDLPASSGTVTTIASSLNPSNLGEYVTFTATVYPVSSSATPAGTVQFSVGTSPLGPPVALNSSGVATYTTAALFAGGGSITAAYIPGSGSPFAASTSSPLQQYVAGDCAGGSATTLTSSQNPSNTDQSVTFTATVAATVFPLCVLGGGPPLNSGTYAPSGIYGTVQFYANGAAMGAQIPVDGSATSGVATYSTSTLPVGTDAITALFMEGNGYVESSTSNTVNQVVNASGSSSSFTIAPSSAALSITQGGSGADTIAVNGAGGFSGSVMLTASGLPTGVTASFGANPTTGTSVLTLAAGSTAAPGIYSVTVTGTSTSTAESAATTVQFAVVSAGASAPPFGASAATVAAGSTAAYPVTLSSDVTGASVACMNLPAGATCSYSSTTNAVTIATSSTTPAGTYQVTVVFTETVATAASAGILLPIALLPLLFLKKKLAARGIWTAACLALILLAATVLSTGCSGAGSTPASPPSTYQITSSATVSLTVQ